MHLYKSKKPSIIYFNILVLYIILSVVNWLPFINNNIVRVLKYIIFIFIFYYEFKNFQFRYPSFYLSPYGLLLILFSMSFGMILSPNINAIIDILLPFIILWIFNFDKEFYYKAIYKSSIIIALICTLQIVSYYTGFFDIEANGPWDSSFSKSGFGGYSTGYSDSLFLFVPFLVFWHRINNKKKYSFETFAILSIIIVQYITGGRAGLVASLLVFFFGYKMSNFYRLLLIGLMIIFFQSEDFLVQMRIVNPYGEEITEDQITSGRIGINTYYFEKFKENPFFGYGFGSKKEFGNIEAHLVWLKNAFNGGIIYLIFLLLIFLNILYMFKNNYSLSRHEKKLFINLFFISFIITFLEPNYLIGSVQGEFVYWLLISLLLKPNLIKTNEDLSLIKN